MKKTGFTGYVYDFSVDYDSIAVDDIKDIHKYLMRKNDIVRVWKTLASQHIKCFGSLKNVFSLDLYFYQT